MMDLKHYSQGTYTPGAPLWKQMLWYGVGSALVQSRLLPFSRLKVWLLRRFGAQVGQSVCMKPGVRVKFPWRLVVGDHVWIGEDVWIDNLATVTVDDHVCISQGAYLCTGNHDWSHPHFVLQTAPIHLQTGSWIAARAVVGPGVTVHEGAVLGLGSVTGRSLAPMTIYTGNPAYPLRERKIQYPEAGASVPSIPPEVPALVQWIP
jgi:putative colanic acid biosynthesis acetyltransferase WcaF